MWVMKEGKGGYVGNERGKGGVMWVMKEGKGGLCG